MVNVLVVVATAACVPFAFGVVVIFTKSPLASFWESMRLSKYTSPLKLLFTPMSPIVKSSNGVVDGENPKVIVTFL